MATPTIEPRSILYQSITDQIIRELEHSTVPWHKPWSCGTLDGRILHPLRYSGERYRGINIVLLWMYGDKSMASQFSPSLAKNMMRCLLRAVIDPHPRDEEIREAWQFFDGLCVLRQGHRTR